MPVENNMTGGNIFEDVFSGVKSVGSYVINKLPSTIGDAVIKNQLISKAAGFIPVIGQPVSTGLRMVGLGKQKKLMGKGITVIKNKRKRKN